MFHYSCWVLFFMSVVLCVVVCYPVMCGYVVRSIVVMIIVCINLFDCSLCYFAYWRWLMKWVLES